MIRLSDYQTPTVISTVGNGIGKSTCSTLRGIGAGDFGAQSFNRVYILLTPYRHAAPLEMAVAASRSHVISTAAGQPPIGKPLIGQARGQLRLTWRLYAESPQSGEISLLYAAWLWCLSRLPAHWYAAALGSLTSRTEILHCVQNDEPAGRLRSVSRLMSDV